LSTSGEAKEFPFEKKCGTLNTKSKKRRWEKQTGSRVSKREPRWETDKDGKAFNRNDKTKKKGTAPGKEKN